MMSAMSRPIGEIIFAVEEAPEGGYLARALGHDILTEADSPDGLRDAVRAAVRCHLDKDDRPKVIRLHFVREGISMVISYAPQQFNWGPTCFDEWASDADAKGYGVL
jgi:hypothetical protein